MKQKHKSIIMDELVGKSKLSVLNEKENLTENIDKFNRKEMSLEDITELKNIVLTVESKIIIDVAIEAAKETYLSTIDRLRAERD